MSRKKPLRSWTDDDAKLSSSLYFETQPHVVPTIVTPAPTSAPLSASSNSKPSQAGMLGFLHSAVSVGVSLFVPEEENVESQEESAPKAYVSNDANRDVNPHPVIMLNDTVTFENENSEEEGSEDDDFSVYFEGMNDDISYKNDATPQAGANGPSFMGLLHRAVLQVAGVESTESVPDIEWWSDHLNALSGSEHGDDDDTLVAQDQDEARGLSYREMYGVSSSIWDIEEKGIEEVRHKITPRPQEIQHNMATLSDEDLQNSPEHSSNDGLNLGIFKYAFKGIKTVIDVQDEIRAEISLKSHSNVAPIPTPPRVRHRRNSEELSLVNTAPRRTITPINPQHMLSIDQFWDQEHSFKEICSPQYWLSAHSKPIPPNSLFHSPQELDETSEMNDARKHRGKESKDVIPLEFVLLGTPGSGKTSLIYRFFFGEFNELGHRSVFPASYLSKTVEVGGTLFVFRIWDTSGDSEAVPIVQMYSRSSRIAVVTYEQGSMSSLEKAKNLVVELRQYSLEHNRGLLIALVGTKCDALEEDLQFSLSAKNFASKYEVVWMETSAKLGSAVRELFSTLATTAVLAADEAGKPIQSTPNVWFDTAPFVKKILEGPGKTCPSPVALPHHDLSRSIQHSFQSKIIAADEVSIWKEKPVVSRNIPSDMTSPPPPPRKNSRRPRAPPVWIEDKDILLCYICDESFGVFTRKHHCRNCGKIVCAACSADRMPILYFNYLDEVRVCQKCVPMVKAGNEKFCTPDGDTLPGTETEPSSVPSPRKQSEFLSFRHSATSSSSRKSQSERLVSPNVSFGFPSQNLSPHPFFLTSTTPLSNNSETPEKISRMEENPSFFDLETTVETNSSSIL